LNKENGTLLSTCPSSNGNYYTFECLDSQKTTASDDTLSREALIGVAVGSVVGALIVGAVVYASCMSTVLSNLMTYKQLFDIARTAIKVAELGRTGRIYIYTAFIHYIY
jgi:hypothetical protein